MRRKIGDNGKKAAGKEGWKEVREQGTVQAPRTKIIAPKYTIIREYQPTKVMLASSRGIILTPLQLSNKSPSTSLHTDEAEHNLAQQLDHPLSFVQQLRKGESASVCPSGPSCWCNLVQVAKLTQAVGQRGCQRKKWVFTPEI